MSAERNSIRLSQFFNDDDSEGHRVAEYLKNRRGNFRPQNCLFIGCETESLSFDVQLEKNSNATEKQVEIGHNVNNGLGQKASDIKLPSESSASDNLTFRKPLQPENVLKKSNERLSTDSFLSLRTNNSPIRKSRAMFSPSDKLRRLSMKNFSAKKIETGRRVLLQEFESTIQDKDFNPAICSTPISQPTQIFTPLVHEPENIIRNAGDNPSLNSNQLSDTANIELTANKPITNETLSGHTDTILKSLQRKDAELQNFMEIILDKTLKNDENHSKVNRENSADKIINCRTNTSTPLKRTFTIEKGSVPGQLILIPEKIIDGQNNRTSNLQCSTTNQENSGHKSLLTRTRTRRNSSKPDANNVTNCSQSVSKTFQVNHSSKRSEKESSLHKIQKENSEISNLPQNRGLSIVIPASNVQLPDTQTNIQENSIVVCSGAEHSIMVIPFNQTINKISSEKKVNITSDNKKQSVSNSANKSEKIQEAVDYLKLTDILTDDEEEAPQNTFQRSQNISEMPLNLAQTSNNIGKKRLRRRHSKQLLFDDTSYQGSTETEMEIPPAAHTRRLLPMRKCKPLNKAPGIPLNGEKYAQELSRMSNYEILDLRKRNSMGKIFIISGHKSNRALEEVKKKKIQLSNIIENELLKRNRKNMSDCSNNQLESQPNIEDIMLPAPKDFRDSLVPEGEAHNITNESALIGETPIDRINFKDIELVRPKPKKKKLPDDLLQYLEISKKYSSKRMPKISMSKRTLFNKDESVKSIKQVSPTKISPERRNSYFTSTRLSVPYLKSPPKRKTDLITTPKAVSPPPPICISRNEVAVDNCIDPPPGFESDSGISSNNFNYQYSENVTLAAGEVVTTNINTNATNDDNLFKKPLKPAPKRKAKNVFKPLTIQEEFAEESQETTASSIELTAGGSLRRSKRGHVPKCQPLILSILHQQILKKEEHYKIKRIEELKKQRKEANKIKKIKINNSKNKMSEPSESQSCSKKKKIINNGLSSVSESNNFDQFQLSSTSNKSGIETKRKERSKKITKRQERIVLINEDDPAPTAICHLNNLADQSKQSSTLNINSIELEEKEKKSPVRNGNRKQKQILPINKNYPPSPSVGHLTNLVKQSKQSSKSNVNFTELKEKEKKRPAKVRNSNRKQKKIVPINEVDQSKQSSTSKVNGTELEVKGKNRSARVKHTHRKQQKQIDRKNEEDYAPPPVELKGKIRPATVRNTDRKQKRQIVPLNENLQSGHLRLKTPPPVDHLNDVFDQLKQCSMSSINVNIDATSPQRPKIKPLRISVRRLKHATTAATHSDNRSSVSSTSSDFIKSNSNKELISWLKNMGDACHPNQPMTTAIKEMRISEATNLCFTELHGVEYAFYDTEEKASLGYLRFKPQQVKPRKRAKRFHLHFINLLGEFRVTTSNGDHILGVGDMVAIEKLAYYDIKNTTDDIGILMVIKK